MGQHFASLRELFKMDGEKNNVEQLSDTFKRSSAYGGLDQEKTENIQGNESNGNVPVLNANALLNKENKPNENLDNELSNLDLDNHNSRFHGMSVYGQSGIACQDSQQQRYSNGNSVEAVNKQDIGLSDSGNGNNSGNPEDGPVNPALRRSLKTLSIGKRKGKLQRSKDTAPVCNHISSKKKRSNWVLKFNCAKNKASKNTDIPGQGNNSPECICTGYRRTEEHSTNASAVPHPYGSRSAPQSPILGPLPPSPILGPLPRSPIFGPLPRSPVIDLSRFNPEEFPMEDCDERARLQRAREIEEGVEPPPGYRPSVVKVYPNGITVDRLAALLQAHAGIQAVALTALSQIDFTLIPSLERPIHTQVDYVHCLVPDLKALTACSYYWGKMNRYEAERLLEGMQDGTFLLRDSAQEEFLFSVSFRRYDRVLHARIEQWNHKFSFDSHDPGVFASETVCGLIEHYKDPSCCMFFEPMLTIPLRRNFAFPLQHLCRAVITTRTTYDDINKLQLPKTLKSYLKEYHYKQRVRIRRLDVDGDTQNEGRIMSYLPVYKC